MSKPLELCPICGSPLRNGTRGKLTHNPEDTALFISGTITEDEYNARGYRLITRICTNGGNGSTLETLQGIAPTSKPCPNYCGEDLSNPRVTVEYLNQKDE